jgi:hypothetical protein
MKTRQSFSFFLLVTMSVISLYFVRANYLKHTLVTVPSQIIYHPMTSPMTTLTFFTDASAAVPLRIDPAVFDVQLQPILSYREGGVEKQQAFALSYP